MCKKLIYLTFFFTLVLGLAGEQAWGQHRAAYRDGRYPSAWAGGQEVMRDALEDAGYEILDADQLKTWMDARIADGMPSVVVFCHDIAPDTVVELASSTCTLRRYLDAGGKIVWYADIPMIYQGHSDGTRTDLGNNGMINILGFDAASGPWDTQDEVTITADGLAWGLTETWRSDRPTSRSGLRVLAEDNRGYAAAWVKHYVRRDSYRGFVRLFDRVGKPNFNDLRRVAEYGMVGNPYARRPNPVDGAVHLYTWANISWYSGDFAVSHNIYFGENFDDVNDSAAEAFLGNQTSEYFIVGFPGFPYPHGLVPDTTYYWRIDEVNDLHPDSPWKGNVWSFSIPSKTAYTPKHFEITYYDNYNYDTDQWDAWQSAETPQDAWDDKYLADGSSGNTVYTDHAFMSITAFDLRGGLFSKDGHASGGEDWNPLQSIGDNVSGQSAHHVFAALFKGLIYLEEGDNLMVASDDDVYVFLDGDTAWGQEVLSIPFVSFFDTDSMTVTAAQAGYHTITVKYIERINDHSGIEITLNGEHLQSAEVAPADVVGRIIYVDADAVGNNDGSSWSNAYLCLQDALAAAEYGDEIRVAQGIYQPDRRFVVGRFARIVASGDRTDTFQLINVVAIKGGYAGFGEQEPDARNIEAYETILSGDLNGDDMSVANPSDLLDESTRAENSFHVVTGSETDATAMFDGFTITSGNANGSGIYSSGGGLHNTFGSPTVANCRFIENAGTWFAGLCNVDRSNPTISNCEFTSNASKSGSAIGNERDCSPEITNCIFIKNFASTHGSGAVINIHQCSPIISDCLFSQNHAGGNGGALENIDNSHSTIIRCDFTGNSTNNSGGAVFNNNKSNPTLINCSFSGNEAHYGGGIHNSDSSPTVVNCTFSANSATRTGGGISSIQDGLPILVNCILWDNSDESGMGVYSSQISGQSVVSYTCVQNSLSSNPWPSEGNIDADPLFVDADGADGVIGTEDDDLSLLPGSPCIDAGDNSAIPESVVTDLDGNPRIVNGIVDMGAYEFSPESAPNLIGWWKLDDGSGTTAIDSSGNGFDIQLYNTTWEDGVFGGALHFHGVGYGDVGNFRYSDNAITLCAWVWHDAFRTGQVERYVTVAPSVAVIRKEGDGPLHFYINTDGNLRHLWVRNVLTEGQWHHVAGTWDGLTQRLYIDGVEIASQVPGGVLGDSSRVIMSLSNAPFNGMLDDVRIYNRTLTQNGIQVIMQGEEFSYAFSPTPPDGAVLADTNVTLSWSPGVSAISHNVYFGDNRDNVDTGTGETFKGNQTETLFNVGSVRSPYLVPGTTYYWRIDEVNADGTTYKGNIWSFSRSP